MIRMYCDKCKQEIYNEPTYFERKYVLSKPFGDDEIRIDLCTHCQFKFNELIDRWLKGKNIEQETGEWIWEDDISGGKRLVCSCCGYQPIIDYFGDYAKTDYCPHCGEKKKIEEGEDK